MPLLTNYFRQCTAGLRILLVLSVILGIGYPLAVTAIAQLPGLSHPADGSLATAGGRIVGSSLIGQNFTDSKGNPLLRYFQTRPSAGSYDPTASGAGNLGPESVVDTLPDPANPKDTGTPSLLTQICTRSKAIGTTYGVDGSRPYCTASGVGAVLAVFYRGPGYHGAVVRAVSLDQACPAKPFLSTYHGVTVQCARFGPDYSHAKIVPIRGNAPAHPAVPADAVTASGSGLDPDISPAYAHLQEALVAKARRITVAQVDTLVHKYESGRGLGFLGEPSVDVLQLDLALDRRYPVHP